MNLYVIAENVQVITEISENKETFSVINLGFLNLKFTSLYMIQLSDDSFENSNKTPRQPKEVKKNDTVPWWITEDEFEDGGKYC